MNIARIRRCPLLCPRFAVAFQAILALIGLLFLANEGTAQFPAIPREFSQANIIDQARILQTQFEAAAEAEVRRRMLAEVDRALRDVRRGTQADLAAAARRRAVDNMAQQKRIARTMADAKSKKPSQDSASQPELNAEANPLPFGFTKTDVVVFDDVFGRFNPLRTASILRLAAADESNVPPSQATIAAWNRQVQNSARHRLAEISELRDTALATTDVTLLKQAARMELALSTYATAALQKPEPATTAPLAAPANPPR